MMQNMVYNSKKIIGALQMGKKLLLLIYLCTIISLSGSLTHAESHDYSMQQIFDSHKSMMLFVDGITGEILDANITACNFYGFQKEELLKMNINQLKILSEEQVKIEMQKAVLEERNFFEFRHRLKNGDVRDEEVYSSPATNKSDESILYSIDYDVTERNQLIQWQNRVRTLTLSALIILVLLLLLANYRIISSKKKEMLAKESYKALFTNVNEGFARHELIINRRGEIDSIRFLDVNETFEKYFGSEINYTTNESVRELIRNKDKIWNDIYSNIPVDDEMIDSIHYSEDYNMVFNVKIHNLPNNQFAIIIRDISHERKHLDNVEKELQLLESILENTLAGYWEWDLSSDKKYFSDRFKKLLGNPNNSIDYSAIKWTDLIYQDDQSKVMKQYNDYINSGGNIPFYCEARINNINDEATWAILSGKIIEWDGLKPVKLVGCVIDISKLKQLEYQLVNERSLLETTLFSIGDGLITTDSNGKIVLMNRVAEKLTGWSLKDAYGQNFEQVFLIVNEYTREPSENPVKKVLETGESFELDNHTTLISKDNNETSIENSAAPIKDSVGIIYGVVVVFRDCTEKNEKNRHIEHLNNYDFMTSVYNRRFFEEEFQRIDSSINLPLTIVMVDINGLKLTNDAFGHETGDKLLKCVAEVLKSGFRKEDIIARVGGDEFVVLLPRTSYDDAECIMKRINVAVEKIEIGNVIPSISAGWETKTSTEEDAKLILSKAEDQLYRKKVIESQSMKSRTVQVIMQTLHITNLREKHHSEKVSKICHKIGLAMHLNENELIELVTSGLMHDIGKIAIKEEILNKPGALSEHEYEEIKRHPEIGYQILKSDDKYLNIANHVLSHHERWDGKGYPKGLFETEISRIARIIAVADAYEAMISERPYKKSLTPMQAIDELRRCSGTQFDPEVVKHMCELFENGLSLEG